MLVFENSVVSRWLRLVDLVRHGAMLFVHRQGVKLNPKMSCKDFGVPSVTPATRGAVIISIDWCVNVPDVGPVCPSGVAPPSIPPPSFRSLLCVCVLVCDFIQALEWQGDSLFAAPLSSTLPHGACVWGLGASTVHLVLLSTCVHAAPVAKLHALWTTPDSRPDKDFDVSEVPRLVDSFNSVMLFEVQPMLTLTRDYIEGTRGQWGCGAHHSCSCTRSWM